MAGDEKGHIEGKDLSWIVRFWAAVFQYLGKISLVPLLRKLPFIQKRMPLFIEVYVFTNTLASVLALAIASYRINFAENLVLLVFVCYGSFRIAEITIYQVNVLFFDEYRAKRIGKPYAVEGFRRLVLLLVHNYFEIVCWFGLIYVWLYRAERLALLNPDPSFFVVVRESMLLMFSFNAYKYEPTDDIAVLAFSIQALVGLFMTLMVFARFMGLLPSPKSKDEMDY